MPYADPTSEAARASRRSRMRRMRGRRLEAQRTLYGDACGECGSRRSVGMYAVERPDGIPPCPGDVRSQRLLLVATLPAREPKCASCGSRHVSRRRRA